jgi:uncharacterized protein YneF (UPF0154 family)
MKNSVKSIIVISVFTVIGVTLGFYLNDLNNRIQAQQVPDYLTISTESYWWMAIPVFVLMIALVAVGYLFSKKVKDANI